LLDKFPAMPGLIGLSDTDLVLAAAPVAARRERIFLTSGATSPLLPAQVPEWLFLACFGDNVQAAAAAEWAFSKRGLRSVSILYRSDSTYTALLRRYFRERWESLGGTVKSEHGYTPNDVSAGISGLEKADLIFVSAEGAGEAISAVRALRAAGFGQPVMGGDGFDAEEEWGKHPELRDVFYTTHVYLGADNQDPVVSAFRDAYEQAYPGIQPDGFSALGYDAARLLATAIERAKSTEPDAVRRQLAEIRDFEGVTGRIGYAAGSRIPTKSVAIIEVIGGALHLAAKVSPKVVPSPGN
jgi:branched-chain amino acid transport system substrate-binding protein